MTVKRVFAARYLGEMTMVTDINIPSEGRVERERHQFRALILGNPNYFGNLKESPFEPVLSIQTNTTYEKIGCVGFQPRFNLLEAVVFINQSFGYGGDPCSDGSPEYVRFYLSFDNGATWEDQGLTNFTAYNVSAKATDGQRLEYATTLKVNPQKKFCFVNNLALARAILSWNSPPPPNTPDFVPVWGDVKESYIQIDPLKLFLIKDVFEVLDVKPIPELETVVNLEQAIASPKPNVLSALELQTLYREKQVNVEPQRFAFNEIQKLIKQPTLTSALTSANLSGSLQGIDIDLSKFGDLFFPEDGNTSYEELTCVGLNPNLDTLVGVIHIKRSSGYSGGPCTAGSREYVTFWADFDNNGTFETCLGTTSVTVYDIDKIPDTGLSYAVYLPVNLSQYRQPCQLGPKVVPIRATLSWQVAPPCGNPNYVPTWGNREETLIFIEPGSIVPPGTQTPAIRTVGSMSVSKIDSTTGLANGAATLVGFTATDSPFGGEVVITGFILPAKDISSGETALKYKISVSDDGINWQPLANKFTIERSQLLDGVITDLADIEQSVDGDGYYTYQEDSIGGPGNAQIFVDGKVLAKWLTYGLTGLWQIRIDVKDPVTNIIYPGADTVTVRLDNEAPQFPLNSFVITTGGGNCADFMIGDMIQGQYAVTDEHFSGVSLDLLPPLGGSFTKTPLASISTGESGTWSLVTAGLPRCGYVVRLTASDRTIVNSGSIGFTSSISVGLCLREG